MATISRPGRGFSFNLTLSLLVRSQGWAQSTDSTKQNSNFQALLEVSYCQDMSPFMDDLRSLNFRVFNATRS